MLIQTLSHGKKIAALAALIVMLGGCENPSSTAKFVVGGAAIGAGVGMAAVAATSGCIPCAAGLGAAVGAGIGLAFDVLENKR